MTSSPRRPIMNEGLNHHSNGNNSKEQIEVGHRFTDEPRKGNVDRGRLLNGSRQTTVVQYAVRPCTPSHNTIKESPLSSDAIFRQSRTSGKCSTSFSVDGVQCPICSRKAAKLDDLSHAGLFNLCIVVLVAVNSRLIIENLMKFKIIERLATSYVLVMLLLPGTFFSGLSYKFSTIKNSYSGSLCGIASAITD
ncbi:hypothetical protein Ccrd_020559 [Cynara cardunculus var. scolymus]|uniref:Uncharacterized protein n=1 Tax=Cynara cardunculus var. scolymus TaxID=59895 RepID=A0A103Y281_CYNCS|nr:hypothetical protein Ccrd_020559 [Cynara cardunculus var. scolymus]